MKKWFISILCLLVIVFGGCGLNPDSILQKEENISENDIVIEEAMSDSQEEISEADGEAEISSGMGTQESNRIFAYICGAVNAPGVYELDSDSRIFQLVELAGGLTEDADERSVNLAETVSDGQMVRILTVEEREAGETAEVGDSHMAAGSGITDDGKVNINKASVQELTSLNGIGEAKAASIIAYRESHGSFQSIEEIMQVDGIAQGTYEKIKDNITV